MEQSTNSVELQGILAGRPAYSHSAGGDVYFRFPLTVQRLSGVADTVNIIARRELLQQTEILDGDRVYVQGELRSFNNKSGYGNKLVITVFARLLEIREGEDLNRVRLFGAICKPPTLRRTPMGREICDIMLAVNRRYGRSDYLPCIAWGRVAERVACWNVGTQLRLTGRIQSRNYIKNENDVAVEKTAFEVSVMDAERLEEAAPEAARQAER